MHVSLEIVERRVIAFPVCSHDRAKTFMTAIYRQNRNVRGVFFTIYNTRFLYKKKKTAIFTSGFEYSFANDAIFYWVCNSFFFAPQGY